jgi:hypothetical protein
MQQHRQASSTGKSLAAHDAGNASVVPAPGKTTRVQQQAQGGPIAEAASSHDARHAIIDAGKGSLNEMKRGLEAMHDALTDTGDTIKAHIDAARAAAKKCDIPGLQLAIDKAAALITASWTSALLKEVKNMTDATHSVLNDLKGKDNHSKNESIREYLESLIDSAHSISESATDHEKHTQEVNKILVDAKQLCGSLVPAKKVEKYSSGGIKLQWSLNPTLTHGITLKRSLPTSVSPLQLPGHGHIKNVTPFTPQALQAPSSDHGSFALTA